MKCYVGLGSNVGNRFANLESASQRLPGFLRVSPVVQSPALVPPHSPVEWNKSYLNAVAEIEYCGSCEDLLVELKTIEKEMGRTEGPRWSPRLIDLDVLLFGEQILKTPGLTIPHPEMLQRNFVLQPLKHLIPNFKVPGMDETVLTLSRRIESLPIWMGITNVTPDSFSDGGRLGDDIAIFEQLETQWQAWTQILDIGAESTRPNAVPVSEEEEWSRLRPGLSYLQAKLKGKTIRPLISVDTRHVAVAERALLAGVDMINDVGALADRQMIDLVKTSGCQYVLMHSLSVPANPQVVLPREIDVVEHIHQWARRRIAELTTAGVSLSQIIFDPGIGFGKSAQQSLEVLRRVDEFSDLPVRILIGHSRKSFLSMWTDQKAAGRDPESVGISLALARKKVDILRVHEPALHQRAFNVMREIE